jgi:hypothetical protein
MQINIIAARKGLGCGSKASQSQASPWVRLGGVGIRTVAASYPSIHLHKLRERKARNSRARTGSDRLFIC